MLRAGASLAEKKEEKKAVSDALLFSHRSLSDGRGGDGGGGDGG